MKQIKIVFQLLRIPHWIKNGFVLAPLLFAQKIHEMDRSLKVSAAFFVFCIASSSIYILNDIFDLENDKKHPIKSKRPLASGAISVRSALLISIPMTIVSLILSFFISKSFFVVILLYIFQNILYSLYLKHIVILDIFIVAFGFVLRVIGGGYAANVDNSYWILICTVLLSLFLGFSKRRHEIVLLGKGAEEHRKILSEYSTQFLDQMIGIVTACTVMSYMLYTISEETVKKFGTGNLIYTSLFVLYGVCRYLYLVYQKEEGGSPTRIMITDIPLIINVVLWVATCAVIIYRS